MRKQWRIMVYVVSWALLGAMVVVSSVAAQQPKPTKYSLTWYPTGTTGTTYGIAVAAASLINKYSPLPGLPKLNVSVVPGKGTIEHTRQLIEGTIDVGLSNTFIVLDAYNAVGDWAKFGSKGKDLRILFSANVTATQIYTLWDGPVKTIWDIKGKRVADQPKAMSAQRLNAAILEAAGWNQDKDMKTTYYATMDAQFDSLKDGHSDLIIMATGVPSSGTLELFTIKHCRLIPIPDEVAKKAVAKNPAWSRITVPANTYPKQDYPAPTIGYVTLWATTTRLPDEVAYEICKISHENYKEGVEMFKPYGDFKDLFVDLEVPYHPGAAKYWKEVGLLKK